MGHTTNHFDLIVLGTDLAGLVVAALAARRGKRVAVLPQGPGLGSLRHGSTEYRLEDFPVLGLSSAGCRRVFEELGLWAQIQRQRRRLGGHLHLCADGERIDALDDADFRRQCARRFADDPIDAAFESLDGAIARSSTALEDILASDAFSSPQGFWARRFLTRASAELKRVAGDPFAPLVEGHPLRSLASAILPWVQNLDPSLLGQGAALRLVDRFYRVREDHAGGLADLRARLVEAIREKSGEFRPQVRIADILVKRGRVTGVDLLGKSERYGCGQLLLASDPSGLIDAGWLPDPAPKALRAALTELRPFAHRYGLHLLLAPEGVSPAFDGCVVLPGAHESPALENLYVRRRPDPEGQGVRVTITRIVPAARAEEETLDTLREETLDRLHHTGVLPFCRRHLRAAYSPHDGLGIDGRPGQSESSHAGSARRLPMSALFDTPRGSVLGLGLLPFASGISNLTIASRVTYPGLGVEGEILAGYAAAARIAPLEGDRRWWSFARRPRA